jgi:AsmA protein
MSKPVKYFLIAAASIGVLIIAAILTITTLVDVERYKPEIEQLVTEKTGYPLTLGGKIGLSLFPWVGLSFTNLQLDNPEGFVNKTFVRVDGFQARLKVLPLLSRKVEISSFVVNRPEIFLEKSPKGTWNWEKLTEGKKPSTIPAPGKATAPASGNIEKAPPQDNQEKGGFVLESLIVGEFSITDGRVQINDLENNLKREVSDFTLQLADVSLDKPIKMSMRAMLDGKPLSLKGSVGPLGPDPGAGKINLDLEIQALETLNIQVSGYLEDIKEKKTYKLAVNLEPFSVKQLFSHLGLSFPVTTTDPQALDKVGLRATIAGDTTQVVLSNSNILLDDSSINLDLTAKDFSRPDLAFNVEVDSIDLDRYLPPAAAENKPVAGQSQTEASKEPASQQTTATASSGKTPSGQAKQNSGINYEPLRKLVLKGTMKLGQVTVHGGTINNVALDVAGRDGLFTINSLGMELYEGNIAATGKLNVQKNIPITNLNLTLQGVQVGPLLKDFAQKEIIEGMLKAEVVLNLQGDNADRIKQSLNGKGDLLFQDGALIGLDLAQMARNIKSGFTLEQQGERPKTDFAELHAPFSITNGLVNTPETILRSPFIRVSATGDANLVNEALDMKIRPTIVGTIKGQGDEEKRGGLTVPVLVGGTFKAPKFSPDLESLVKDQMPSEKELGEIIKTGKVPAERKEQLEQAKGLLKGLFGK